MSGYTAGEANVQLNHLANEADKDFQKTKNAARDAASKTSNAAVSAFNDAGNAFKHIGKKKHHKGPDPKFASSVFDWDFYYDYDQSPDVVAAKIDLPTHWRGNGFAEGRQGSPEFSVRSYLAHDPDVQNRVGAGNYADALEDWLTSGSDAGRDGHPDATIAGPIAGPAVAGGTGGGAWDEGGTCAGQYVSGFRVRAGSEVDAVEFLYPGQGWAP